MTSPRILSGLTCPEGKAVVSVQGGKDLCAKIPVCVGNSNAGHCPGPDDGLAEGSSCALVASGVYGCILGGSKGGPSETPTLPAPQEDNSASPKPSSSPAERESSSSHSIELESSTEIQNGHHMPPTGLPSTTGSKKDCKQAQDPVEEEPLPEYEILPDVEAVEDDSAVSGTSQISDEPEDPFAKEPTPAAATVQPATPLQTQPIDGFIDSNYDLPDRPAVPVDSEPAAPKNNPTAAYPAPAPIEVVAPEPAPDPAPDDVYSPQGEGEEVPSSPSSPNASKPCDCDKDMTTSSNSLPLPPDLDLPEGSVAKEPQPSAPVTPCPKTQGRGGIGVASQEVVDSPSIDISPGPAGADSNSHKYGEPSGVTAGTGVDSLEPETDSYSGAPTSKKTLYPSSSNEDENEEPVQSDSDSYGSQISSQDSGTEPMTVVTAPVLPPSDTSESTDAPHSGLPAQQSMSTPPAAEVVDTNPAPVPPPLDMRPAPTNGDNAISQILNGATSGNADIGGGALKGIQSALQSAVPQSKGNMGQNQAGSPLANLVDSVLRPAADIAVNTMSNLGRGGGLQQVGNLLNQHGVGQYLQPVMNAINQIGGGGGGRGSGRSITPAGPASGADGYGSAPAPASSYTSPSGKKSASTARVDQTSFPPMAPNNVMTQAMAQLILEQTNLHRAFHGLGPVKWNQGVAQFLQGHANGCPPEHIYAGLAGFSENLHYSGCPVDCKTKAACMQTFSPVSGWYFSDGHRRNLLEPNVISIGCAAARCSRWPGMIWCRYERGGGGSQLTPPANPNICRHPWAYNCNTKSLSCGGGGGYGGGQGGGGMGRGWWPFGRSLSALPADTNSTVESSGQFEPQGASLGQEESHLLMPLPAVLFACLALVIATLAFTWWFRSLTRRKHCRTDDESSPMTPIGSVNASAGDLLYPPKSDGDKARDIMQQSL